MLSRTLTRGSHRALSYTESAVLLSTARAVSSRLHTTSRPSVQRPKVWICRRAMSNPAPHVNVSDLPMEQYHSLADATMTSLLDQLEGLLDEVANDAFEVDYHSGVLTLNLGANGTYVINKQPPNKQIWLSSPVRFVQLSVRQPRESSSVVPHPWLSRTLPDNVTRVDMGNAILMNNSFAARMLLGSCVQWVISGPKRYDYVHTTDDWRYSRDGEGMGTLMERELSRALGREVNLGLERISENVE